MDRDMARELLISNGWADVAEGICAAMRPHVSIAIDAMDEDDAPIGGSRLGGSPDLPDEMDWPAARSGPLSFLLQLDLADVADLPGAEDLPPRGRLWFFFDTVDAQSGRVLFQDAEAGALVRVEADPPAPALAPCRLVFRGDEWSLPAPPLLVASKASRLLETYWNATSDHRLMGHSVPHDHWPAELECAVRAEASPKSTSPWRVGTQPKREPATEEARRKPPPWRLLLQLGSDASKGMTWGDGAALYFCIRAEDLEARRFDRACAVLHTN